MALTLSITDNANGTGATATISGSDPATTNTVYTQAPGSTSWITSGSRSGDGTASLALMVGYYFAYAKGTVSGSPGVSSVVGQFVVTGGTEVLQEKLWNAIIADIQSIAPVSLPGLNGDNVYKRKFAANEAGISLPAVFVTCPVAESQMGGTNIRDDWGRPFTFQIVTGKGIDWKDDIPDLLLWRDRLIKRFLNQRLAAVPEVQGVSLEPGPIFDPRVPSYEHTVSSFTLRFRTRETRGV